MKVTGFNGSPRKNGNTEHSLNTVFTELEKAGIETEMIHVEYGKKEIPAPEPVAKTMTNFIR